jgi:5'-nucleotidase
VSKPQILLTNDDGIRSPGLWAAAEALSALGFVTVAAPREQSSGMGRSLPLNSDGIIRVEKVQVNGQDWTVHAVGGSPAQAVLHGILEIMPQQPDLVVSGINYGGNMGTGITVSGTVGAAMEAAALGLPALAVSLETAQHHHLSYSTEVNFSPAAWFTAHFAGLLLKKTLPPEVSLLNLNVPAQATEKTPWMLTRLARQRFYDPVPPVRTSWDQPGTIGYREVAHRDDALDSDVYVIRFLGRVSVTPLTLDMTSRIEFDELEWVLRGK